MSRYDPAVEHIDEPGARSGPSPAGVRVRRAATPELTPQETRRIREMLWAAFADDDPMTEDDWRHALGGVHFVGEVDGEIVAHAAVVERLVYVGGRPLRTGYVEAVATRGDRQNRGFGSAVMADAGAYIAERFELGALGTGRHAFYERLGWRRWRGPSSVRTAAGDTPTPDDDGYLLVLATPSSPPLDLDAPIACDWRAGDVW